jgi:hypothetical protein
MNIEQFEQQSLKKVHEKDFWIGVTFINHKIKAKVFANDTFERLI